VEVSYGRINPWPRRILLVFIILAVAAAAAFGIYKYEQQVAERKKQAELVNSLNGLKIEPNDKKTILEYSTTPVDAKTLVTVTNRSNSSADTTITADPDKIDTSIIGDVDVLYTATSKDSAGNEISNTVTVTVTVKDTQAPEIKVDKDSIDVEQDSTLYDEKAIVVSVKDPVDGDLPYMDKAPDNSDSGYYNLSSNVNLAVVGSYQVKIHAVDKNGNASDKTVTINIVEKEVITPAATADTTNTNTNSSKSDVPVQEPTQEPVQTPEPTPTPISTAQAPGYNFQ